MSLATSNRDGGRTNEAGHLRGVTKGFAGQVLSGLNVTQRGAGANMSVDVAIGDAIIQRSDNTYGHPAWNDAVYNRTIATADGSNPRRDIVVMYIDYGQAPSTGVANNTNGVVKIISVPGTAAGSPVDPSNATIQSAVGSGNPFIKLARVRVAAGATSISNSVIDDLRSMASSVPQGGWNYDVTYSWVYASASTFTIAGVDARAQFPIGTRLMLLQGGTLKFFRVTGTAFSTNTTVTVSGGGTYTLANLPIDKPAFSYDFSPADFPLFKVLSPDIDFSSFVKHFVDKRGQITYGNPANFSTYVDMTGATYSLTPDRNYLYFAFLQCRPGNGTGNKGVRILENGVTVSSEISQNLNSSGSTIVGFYSGLMTSGTPYTIKAQFASSTASDILYSAHFVVLAIPV